MAEDYKKDPYDWRNDWDDGYSAAIKTILSLHPRTNRVETWGMSKLEKAAYRKGIADLKIMIKKLLEEAV